MTQAPTKPRRWLLAVDPRVYHWDTLFVKGPSRRGCPSGRPGDQRPAANALVLWELASSVKKCRAHYTRKDKINGSPQCKDFKGDFGSGCCSSTGREGASPIRLTNIHKHVIAANLDRVAVHA